MRQEVIQFIVFSSIDQHKCDEWEPQINKCYYLYDTDIREEFDSGYEDDEGEYQEDTETKRCFMINQDHEDYVNEMYHCYIPKYECEYKIFSIEVCIDENDNIIGLGSKKHKGEVA